MESSDNEGALDKYFYSYNNSGLISGIQRNRRGLDAVSGQYDYKYDAIGRLTESSHNGQVKSAYEYDAFGNRTSLVEENTKTAYKYDVLDRLVEAKELNNSQAIVKTYDYDKRGNQTKEFVDGLLQKTFTFDATNMLAKVVDSSKGEVENQYNGLGYRVASTRPEEKIEYLCDLSRDYYNLLERTVNGETESFIYDNNVISMSKEGNNYYYLQDELGSPMYMTGTDGVALSSYAFDDFGRNIDPRTGKQRMHEYKVEGNIIQPFAFIGYQEDEVSGLKFAQARFYSANTGRFQSEDNVKGFIDAPFTLNHYGYCWENPVGLVDLDGNLPAKVDVAIDEAKSFWNKYLFGKEVTVSYGGNMVDVKGAVGVKQTAKHVSTVSDDGNRLFKLTTNTDLDTNKTTYTFSVNIKGFIGGSKHETGMNLKLSTGFSSDWSINAGVSGKVSIDGAHIDASGNASAGFEKGLTVDAKGGFGYRENTIGLGAALDGLRMEDTFRVYGYHSYYKNGTSITTQVNAYIRMALAYIFVGMAYYLYSGNPEVLEKAQSYCHL